MLALLAALTVALLVGFALGVLCGPVVVATLARQF